MDHQSEKKLYVKPSVDDHGAVTTVTAHGKRLCGSPPITCKSTGTHVRWKVAKIIRWKRSWWGF